MYMDKKRIVLFGALLGLAVVLLGVLVLTMLRPTSTEIGRASCRERV